MVVNHALVVVDLQRRVVALDTEPHTSAEVVRRSRDLICWFRLQGLPVVFVHTTDLDRPDPIGDALVESLGRRPDESLVTKHHWGAFHGTSLDLVLRGSHVQGIVLAGLMTNFGVEGTARSADELGYEIVFVEDAMASFSLSAHAFAITEIFPRLGRTVQVKDLVLTPPRDD
jgi:nicotinamidase-related amidase